MVDVDLGIPGLEWQSTLGRGGSGTVYRAFDEAHGRQVAVKVLDRALDDPGRRRFDRERRAMGSLGSHPNIVTILTSGVSSHGLPYLVMDQMPNGSLADRLRNGPLDADQVVDIGRHLADALAAAHRAGIVHCDVKPENVLMSDTGVPMLTDFGIASVAGDLTMRVTVSATPSFGAPEILNGRDPDRRSDIYSLAATLFACLEGHPPYGETSETMLGVLYQIINGPVPTIERADVPPHVVRALEQAMAKDPDDRPATMDDFAAELTGKATVGTAPVPVAAGPEHQSATIVRRGRRSTLAGVAVLGLLVIGVLGRWLVVGDDDRIEVPDITGLALTDATKAVVAAGLTSDHGPACESAVVRSSEPPVGTAVDPESVVTLDIAPCIVPDFVGMRLQEAIDLVITIDGLSISWDDYCEDVVLGQSPPAGSAVDVDATIAIELRPC